jgi:hypothetical protein
VRSGEYDECRRRNMNSSLFQQMRTEVLIVMEMSMLVFWDVKQCTLAGLKIEAV